MCAFLTFSPALPFFVGCVTDLAIVCLIDDAVLDSVSYVPLMEIVLNACMQFLLWCWWVVHCVVLTLPYLSWCLLSERP